MATKLHIENFQSWPVADLELDGLTVVVGDSNLGKSSLQRALKGALRNELAPRQIRIGSDLMKVAVTIEGSTATAELPNKKKPSVTYDVDGTPYAKLDGEIPEKVRDLNMGLVDLGDNTLDPIFATQFGSQFILEEKPQALNAILGAFSSTDRLEQGKRTCNTEIGELNSEAKLKAKDARLAEEVKARMTLLDERGRAIAVRLDTLEPSLALHQRQSDALRFMIEHKTRLTRIQTALAKLRVPSDAEIIKLRTVAEALEYQVLYRTRFSFRLDMLEALVVPAVGPTARKVELTTALHALIASKSTYTSVTGALAKFNVPSPDHATLAVARAESLKLMLDSRQRLAGLKDSLTAIQVVVTHWQVVVAKFKQFKSMAEMEAAIQQRDHSVVSTYLRRIDEAQAKVEVHVIRVGKLQAGITQYAALLRAKTAQQAALNQIALNEQGQADADAEVASLLAELEAARQEELKAHMLVCDNCGHEVHQQVN